jgi:uncharacterized OsmC-like protein
MTRQSDIEISPKVPRTPEGTACIWHEFWKLQQRHQSAPGIRARVRLVRAEGDESQLALETGSGHQFTLDHGEGAVGPEPAELLTGALAGSLAFEVVAYLRKRQRLTDYEIRVEAQQAERRPRQIVTVRIHHIITGEGVDPAAVSEAIRIAEKLCMMQDLLRHTATITTTFEVIEKMTEKPEGGLPEVSVPASERSSSRQTGRSSA